MNKNNTEQRIMNFTARIDGETDHLSGHAALYDTEYRYTLADDEGRSIEVVERIKPGAFTDELINKSDVKATINHDGWPVLARSKNGQGTMKLTADERGLHFSFKAAESHKEVVETVTRGDVDQCSYKYIVKDEDITVQEDGSVLREIRSFHSLHDICLATYPAYEDTYVTTEQRTKDKIMSLITPKEDDSAAKELEQVDMLIKITE